MLTLWRPLDLGQRGGRQTALALALGMGVVVSTGRKTDGAGANFVGFSSIG